MEADRKKIMGNRKRILDKMLKLGLAQKQHTTRNSIIRQFLKCFYNG